MANDVGQAYVGILPSLEGFSARLRTALAAELRGVADQIGGEGATAGRSFGQRLRDGISEKLSGIGQMLKTGLLVGTTAAVAGLGMLTTFGLKSAGAMEQTSIGIEALVGNAQDAKKFLGELQQFAAQTPFEFSGVADASRRILAFGQAVGITGDQVIPTMTTIGDLVSVLGGGQENLDAVVRAMGQIASTGHLMGGDLLQIAQALPGFDVHAAIAAKLGVSVAEAMKMQEAGEIDAKTAIDALLEGMANFKGAAGAMQKQSLTLNGVLSTFKDTVGIALTNAFQPVIPAIKDTITQITPIIGDALNQMAPALGGVLTTLLSLVGSAVQGLAPILTSALGMVQGLLGSGLADTIAPLGQAIGGLFAAIAPLAPVVGQMLGALLGALTPVMASLTPFVQQLVPALIQVLTPLTPILTMLAQAAGDILGPVLQVVGGIFAALAPVIATVLKVFAKLLAPMLDTINPLLGVFLEALMPLLPTITLLADPIAQLALALAPLVQLLAELLVVAVSILDPFLKLDALLIRLGLQYVLVPLITMLADALGGLLKPIQWLNPEIQKLIYWLNSLNWHQIADSIGGALTDAWHATVRFFDDMGSRFYNLPGKIADWVGDTSKTLYHAGENLIIGLFNGVTSLGGWVERQLQDFVSNHITGPVRRFLGIQSPSTVFAQIGEYSIEGYVQGVTDSAKQASSATTATLTPAMPSVALAPAAPAATTPVRITAGDSLMEALFARIRDHVGSRYGNDVTFALQAA